LTLGYDAGVFWFFRKRGSADALKNRLQTMLAADRAGISAGKQAELHGELLKVFKTYFPNLNTMQLELRKDGEVVKIAADLELQRGGRKPERKLGRNDVCWCGSGLKFKQCHGRISA
jgi:cell division topological specificity factor MinE